MKETKANTLIFHIYGTKYNRNTHIYEYTVHLTLPPLILYYEYFLLHSKYCFSVGITILYLAFSSHKSFSHFSNKFTLTSFITLNISLFI